MPSLCSDPSLAAEPPAVSPPIRSCSWSLGSWAFCSGVPTWGVWAATGTAAPTPNARATSSTRSRGKRGCSGPIISPSEWRVPGPGRLEAGPGRFTSSEEDEEGDQQREQAHCLDQGEADDREGEDPLLHRGVAADGRDQRREDVADADADAEQGDGRQAGADRLGRQHELRCGLHVHAVSPRDLAWFGSTTTGERRVQGLANLRPQCMWIASFR